MSGFGGLFNFEELPENMRAQILAMQKAQEDAHTRRHMEVDDWRNAVRAMMTEIPPDHLVTVRKLLELTIPDESGVTAAFYDGQITTYLEVVHGVCATHGTVCPDKHDASALLGPSPADPAPIEQPEVQGGHSSADLETITANMNMYKVRPVSEGDLDGPVLCVVCEKQTWPNLKDRMLRQQGEGGCPTCVHAAKWGG